MTSPLLRGTSDNEISKEIHIWAGGRARLQLEKDQINSSFDV